MTHILHIETSVSICSVAISGDKKLIGCLRGTAENDHASQLTLLIKKLLYSASITTKNLAAISVSAGPGSFTGLRIGVSTAKGICQGLNIPLISINTLQSMAYGASQKVEFHQHLYCPMIDARRMEVYTAIYNSSMETILTTRALIMDENPFVELLKNNKLVFFGTGLSKCKNILQNSNSIYEDNFEQTAVNLLSLTYEKYEAGSFENLALYEPDYIKGFYSPPVVK